MPNPDNNPLEAIRREEFERDQERLLQQIDHRHRRLLQRGAEVEAEPEPEPVLEAWPEPVLEAQPEPVLEAQPEPEPEAEAEPEPEPELDLGLDAQQEQKRNEDWNGNEMGNGLLEEENNEDGQRRRRQRQRRVRRRRRAEFAQENNDEDDDRIDINNIRPIEVLGFGGRLSAFLWTILTITTCNVALAIFFFMCPIGLGPLFSQTDCINLSSLFFPTLSLCCGLG
ncbi:TonB domain-containing protein [Reticulomyxa filosa]|uniref:TonB domain-containing protein n=1 Tax=Reticulomyxa filosa TaxID=46433 RepID=X6N1K1_RETFI|nr:TonB domain-containing protein [Reticulomyxa filosa]|eukprot:ETO19197.1 TonB domain-containing protein [Reticulomyxa filosa]